VAQITWTIGARDDLRRTHEFIAVDSPRAAETLIERLLKSTERLTFFPESGRLLPEAPELSYREIIVASYRVIYRVSEDAVMILAITHGRRRLSVVDLDDT
jgi:plasmid stabilization system protein ParE